MNNTASKQRLTGPTKTLAVIILAMINLRIWLHYSELGFFEFLLFEMSSGILLFILPGVTLLYRVFKYSSLKNCLPDFILTAAGAFILHFGLSNEHLDKLDWEVNYPRRAKIAALAKVAYLDHISADYTIPPPLALYPSFKSKEVRIKKTKDAFVTITFFTDRGLLDHYSAFVYTDNPEDIARFEADVKNGGNDFEMKKNWYFIHQ